jgi:hypothetical protein
MRRILVFAAVAEFGTGLFLVLDPAMVVRLLLGTEISGAGMLVGRFFGMALLALGLGCWPSKRNGDSNAQAFRAMLFYNLLVALYLAYLGTGGHLGVLLWPVVVLHAAVALLLVWAWRVQRRVTAISK